MHTHTHTHAQTADVEHLQDFERDVKALLQETLWFLSVRRVSSEREQQMKEHSHATEIQMKVLLCGESDYCVSHLYRVL